MLYGWTGKILIVDLSSKEISLLNTEKYIPDFIGGRGLSSRIAHELLKPGIGPYDPENIMILMTGPLAGTLAPTSGRGLISSISPKVYPSPWYTRSSIGGYWAPELKYAGYDGIIIKGKASRPSYLLINDNKVTIEESSRLWGRGTLDTQTMLRDIHGSKHQILCIGPAGENLVRSATIQHNLGNASGNAGFGAVMGSKMLKAIAIRGTGSVNIADPEKFLTDCIYVKEEIRTGPNFMGMASTKIGEPGNHNCSLGCPVNCIPCKSWKNIPSKIGSGSFTTITHCLDFRNKWDFAEYDRPEVPQYHIKAPPGFNGGMDYHQYMKNLGLNEWEYLNYYQWFEIFKRNGIGSIKGFKLDIDSDRFWLEFFSMMANREGIGDIFAEGIIRAKDRLDELDIPEDKWDDIIRIANFLQPAYGFSDHRTGRSLGSQPSPIWIYSMLHWAFDSKDPMSSHHGSSFIQYIFPPHKEVPKPYADVPFEKIKEVYGQIFGNEDTIAPGLEPIKDKVAASIWFQHRSAIKDSLLVCDWVFPRTFKAFESQEKLDQADNLKGDLDMEARLFSSATGVKLNTEELEKCGERICNLDRLLQINIFNRNREVDETIGWLFELPEQTDGSKLDRETFVKYLDNYYDLRGWDKKSGEPNKEKLMELGLESF